MSQDTSRSVRTSHASGSRSVQTEILNFPVNDILQVSCDGILRCDWCALHGAGRQVALWPNPIPFPSVRNRVWPRETTLPYVSMLLSLLAKMKGFSNDGLPVNVLEESLGLTVDESIPTSYSRLVSSSDISTSVGAVATGLPLKVMSL